VNSEFAGCGEALSLATEPAPQCVAHPARGWGLRPAAPRREVLQLQCEIKSVIIREEARVE